MSEYTIYNDDCLSRLDKIDAESVDCIVTDPPYGLTSITKRFRKDGSSARLSKGFMGKEWDGSGIEYNVEMWEKCLRVLKPGGYLLAFGGSRTFHRIACAIEDAGFELRDTIMWLYGSGFPKSMNIGLAVDNKRGVESKIVGEQSSHDIRSGGLVGKKYSRITTYKKEAQNEWKGWGTCLKPSFEPIIVARKPFKGSLVDNVLKHGVGGLNIDECRVGVETIKGGTMPDLRDVGRKSKEQIGIDKLSFGQVRGAKRKPMESHTGRFPANTVLTYNESDFDEVCGGLPNTAPTKPHGGDGKALDTRGQGYGFKRMPSTLSDRGGSAARYFYCAKASTKDRDEGLEEHSIHPTVKPTMLMQYLVRLVTPKGATILDPFMGSGSTGKAVMYENKERNARYKFIGIEKDSEYCKIAEARIKFAQEGKDGKAD